MFVVANVVLSKISSFVKYHVVLYFVISRFYQERGALLLNCAVTIQAKCRRYEKLLPDWPSNPSPN